MFASSNWHYIQLPNHAYPRFVMLCMPVVLPQVLGWHSASALMLQCYRWMWCGTLCSFWHSVALRESLQTVWLSASKVIMQLCPTPSDFLQQEFPYQILLPSNSLFLTLFLPLYCQLRRSQIFAAMGYIYIIYIMTLQVTVRSLQQSVCVAQYRKLWLLSTPCC